jgi:hypothetical protein
MTTNTPQHGDDIDLSKYDLSKIFISFKPGTSKEEKERAIKSMIRKGIIKPKLLKKPLTRNVTNYRECKHD